MTKTLTKPKKIEYSEYAYYLNGENFSLKNGVKGACTTIHLSLGVGIAAGSQWGVGAGIAVGGFAAVCSFVGHGLR